MNSYIIDIKNKNGEDSLRFTIKPELIEGQECFSMGFSALTSNLYTSMGAVFGVKTLDEIIETLSRLRERMVKDENH